MWTISFAAVQKLGLVSDAVENRSARIEQNGLQPRTGRDLYSHWPD
jgi:hypothetical protein